MELTLPILGKCLCGAVSYTCTKPPVWSVNCHCRSCQKLSGAPFVSAFSVPSQSVSIDGELISFERVAESGNRVNTYHCANCGARIYAQSSGALHLKNLFAATLADPKAFQPVSNVFLSEAAGWIDPPEARFNFQRMPEA